MTGARYITLHCSWTVGEVGGGQGAVTKHLLHFRFFFGLTHFSRTAKCTTSGKLKGGVEEKFSSLLTSALDGGGQFHTLAAISQGKLDTVPNGQKGSGPWPVWTWQRRVNYVLLPRIEPPSSRVYKRKVSLCLTKHNAMKTYWGSGDIAPLILVLGTRCRWVVSFTPWPLYPQGKSPWYPLDRRLGGPQSRSGRGGEEKNSQPAPGIEP
jgi:hypothetical protein